MSISGSLSAALSGLAAASRSAEVISANVSNALTEGYGAREIELAARDSHRSAGGVSVVGVARRADPALTENRRFAEAGTSQARTRADYFESLQRILGTADGTGSISGALTELEAQLVQTAARPESSAELYALAQTASALTGSFRSASTHIQSLRAEADAAIELAVTTVNSRLGQIADLNTRIMGLHRSGGAANALLDQRQALIDDISAIVPVHETTSNLDQVTLYTAGGAVLLDGRPAELGFTGTGVITADMTMASGGLSGLTLRGQSISTETAGPLAGGELGALFDIRDRLAPGAQADLDAVAWELVTRFSATSADPTLPADAPGLFTDAQQSISASAEAGLAARLELNSAIDPADAGSHWRLRDGIGAATPGDAGDNTRLNALLDALTNAATPASTALSTAPQSVADLFAGVLSHSSIDADRALSDRAFEADKFQALKTLELQLGVDTDQEMQKLILVEQAFAANARVISTVDDLINTLLGL